jgi:Cd2+/Zn2+-exporting ATPase
MEHNTEMEVRVEGMDCSDCAMVIEHSLTRIDGVVKANVNYPGQKMRVEFDARKTNRAAIEKRVRSLGYEIPLNRSLSWFLKNRALIFSLAAGILLAAGWLGGRFGGFPTLVSTTFYLGAYAIGGWDIARHALGALRARELDTDLLMVLAALGAGVLGDFADGALLVFLFSLGHALEERALRRARSAIQALADLTPKTALVRRGGREIEFPADQVILSDLVIVRPGTRLPVDGLVLDGHSAVNQAPITGESIPVDKTPGDKVFAGSINGEGVLQIQVTRLAKDSTLARVVKLVEEAQTQKSPTQQSVEKFQRVFVPVVLVVTGLVIFVPLLFGVPFHVSFLRAMTLLVAASPCALALGTPAAILTGIGQAARNGILVKGGAHLEALGRVEAIAFDKTGTITQGIPEVKEVTLFPAPGAPLNSEVEFLRLAAVVELTSGHPLAQAIVRAAGDLPAGFQELGPVKSIPGKGVQTAYKGKALLAGSLKWLEDSDIRISQEVSQEVRNWQARGLTIIAVSWGTEVLGIIGLADTIRAEANIAIQKLTRAGVKETVLLTGDNQPVAEAIARQAGIKSVMANLLPEEKLSAIRVLSNQYKTIAMVGDGVNDAPALAHAAVGIAMGGASTDVALETADVALMGDDLSRLPFAVGLGRATQRVIVQNLAIALGVIGILATTSIIGLAGIGVAIFFHEGSTLLVVVNALRLLGYRSA